MSTHLSKSNIFLKINIYFEFKSLNLSQNYNNFNKVFGGIKVHTATIREISNQHKLKSQIYYILNKKLIFFFNCLWWKAQSQDERKCIKLDRYPLDDLPGMSKFPALGRQLQHDTCEYYIYIYIFKIYLKFV